MWHDLPTNDEINEYMTEISRSNIIINKMFYMELKSTVSSL